MKDVSICNTPVDKGKSLFEEIFTEDGTKEILYNLNGKWVRCFSVDNIGFEGLWKAGWDENDKNADDRP